MLVVNSTEDILSKLRNNGWKCSISINNILPLSHKAENASIGNGVYYTYDLQALEQTITSTRQVLEVYVKWQ